MGKLKDAVMAIQDQVFEDTGREIDFDEAGRILTERWATKPGKESVIDLPSFGRVRVKSLGVAESEGEYKFELLEDSASLKKGALVILRDDEVRAGVVEVCS